MSNGDVSRLLEQSQWVIRGTVRQVGAATMPEVAASGNTSVVRVDEMLHGPAQFADHVGHDITLYSADPKGLSEGASAVFFTRSWLYGRSLAVVEVGRVANNGDAKAMAGDITNAGQALADRRLAERLARAELVVVGEVAETKLGPRLERPIESEHVPDWQVAAFKVGDVLKGKPPDRALSVVFPNSTDEMWIDSPKLRPGLAGILILQRNQQEKGWPIMRVPGLSALDPLDYQPMESLERVRRLIEVGGSK